MFDSTSEPHHGRSVCQFGLSRSGLYAVAEWYIDGVGEPFEHISGGWLDDIPAAPPEFRRFVTLESLRLEFLGQGLQKADSCGAIAWIQLRDPYNWLASLQKGVQNHVVNWPQPISIAKWKDYARLCAAGQEWLNYNRWFQDREYRRDLAARFGFVHHRAGDPWQKVPARGSGSSFDGLRYRHCAQGMEVLQRYQRFLGDAGWRGQFDDEAVALAEALFDMKRVW
jgi:hypothetical protein